MYGNHICEAVKNSLIIYFGDQTNKSSSLSVMRQVSNETSKQIYDGLASILNLLHNSTSRQQFPRGLIHI